MLCTDCLYGALFLENSIQFVRFEVFMATSMKMAVFWDVVPCSLVDIDQRFRGAYIYPRPLHAAYSSP
jgi:hypothetical protein